MFDSYGGFAPAKSAWGEALRLQVRVIAALLRRETRAHFGESRLGYLWAVLEPAGHLMALSLFFTYIMARQVPIGGSMMLFFLTGLIPYFLYVKLGFYLASAISNNKALLNLPPVKPLDVMASRAILETATQVFVAILLFTAMLLHGIDQAVPWNPVMLAEAVAVIALFGSGVGMINAIIQMYMPSWSILFNLVTGPLYMVSGIFFIIEQVPLPLRDYLLYNPLYHLVEWFRAAFYPHYAHTYLDRGYALWWSVSAVLIGWGLMRVKRRKILEPV